MHGILARCVDETFYPTVAIAFAVLLLLLFVRPRQIRRVCFVGGGFLFLVAVVAALKLLTRRERPDGSTHDSFPSGHAAAAAYIAVAASLWMLGFGAGRLRIPGTPEITATAVLCAWGGAVCWSRVAMRRHHASDVVAGVALGVFAALASFAEL